MIFLLEENSTRVKNIKNSVCVFILSLVVSKKRLMNLLLFFLLLPASLIPNKYVLAINFGSTCIRLYPKYIYPIIQTRHKNKSDYISNYKHKKQTSFSLKIISNYKHKKQFFFMKIISNCKHKKIFFFFLKIISNHNHKKQKSFFLKIISNYKHKQKNIFFLKIISKYSFLEHTESKV